MPGPSLEQELILKDFGDGLIMRRATNADAEKLAAFNANIHREEGATEPDEVVAAWTMDLASGNHPTFRPGDFIIVEDTRTGAIASTLNHISQTWEYDGIPFKVGRPEIVGTNPEYRNRGLVRAQFDVLHSWSIERGEPVQAITGINWYYKQFGYAYALELEAGRAGYGPQVPKLKEGETEPFTVRLATEEDIPYIKKLYDMSLKRSLVGCLRDEAMWRYELNGKHESYRYVTGIIHTAEGRPAGYIRHSGKLWHQGLHVGGLELEPGVSWAIAMPSLIRYMWAKGLEYANRDGKEPMGAYSLRLGSNHPSYKYVNERLPRTFRPYAWYIRVPDLPGFIKQIAPAIERNLEASELRGYSGELKVSNYRSGFKMAFDNGKISAVESYRPAITEDGHAFFPELTFLQVLFGYRNVEELEHEHPDCTFASDEARVLTGFLFPRRPSHVVAIS